MWHAPAAVLVAAPSLAGCSSSTTDAPTPVDDSPPPETIREGSVTLSGRDAVIIRGRGNGDALIPEGTQVHRYIVELPDDAVLLASTYDTGDLAFARKIAVLDGMMGTLELTGNDVAPSPS